VGWRGPFLSGHWIKCAYDDRSASSHRLPPGACGGTL